MIVLLIASLVGSVAIFSALSPCGLPIAIIGAPLGGSLLTAVVAAGLLLGRSRPPLSGPSAVLRPGRLLTGPQGLRSLRRRPRKRAS